MCQFLLANSFNCNQKKITLNPHVLSYPLHAYGCGTGSSFLDPASNDIKTSIEMNMQTRMLSLSARRSYTRIVAWIGLGDPMASAAHAMSGVVCKCWLACRSPRFLPTVRDHRFDLHTRTVGFLSANTTAATTNCFFRNIQHMKNIFSPFYYCHARAQCISLANIRNK